MKKNRVAGDIALTFHMILDTSLADTFSVLNELLASSCQFGSLAPLTALSLGLSPCLKTLVVGLVMSLTFGGE